MTIPYGRQWIEEDDILAVEDVLRSDWLTTGPKVGEFERTFAEYVGAREAVAVSSGTAALHAAMFAIGVGSGDEVIVPAMTLTASANCIVYQGGIPVFADVDADTLLLDPSSVESLLSPKTKAVVSVDYAGQPCDYARLRSIAKSRGVVLVADACHSLGGEYSGQRVGTLADLNAFSLHPVKHITTGEGGVITTNDPSLAGRMRRFRNHGITTDLHEREQRGSWFYELVDLGFNYRLTDLQCALGMSQLRKLPAWIDRRGDIASRYDAAFAGNPAIHPLSTASSVRHAYHLYVVRLDLDVLRVGRAEIFRELRQRGIGVNVHYIPVHLHPYYRKNFGTALGDCPVSEAAYERILSLPLFPRMTDEEVENVISSVEEVLRIYTK